MIDEKHFKEFVGRWIEFNQNMHVAFVEYWAQVNSVWMVKDDTDG